jgi:cell wall-associated NlpC family hydrolase
MSITKYPGVLAMFMISALGPAAGAGDIEKNNKTVYRSPYSVKFTFPLRDLLGDLDNGSRGDHRLESSVAFPQWYSRHVRQEYGVWGPPARHYPLPDGLARRSIAWQRERVVAVGLRFQGYEYQHHHVPDWDPPPDWPWLQVRSGHNSKGVDCSNFTAFAYNLGLGLKPSGNVKEQAEHREISGHGANNSRRAERIPKPASYADFVRTLRTGDLLYVRNNKGELAHVVLWIGPIGQSPDNAPLILDSHGQGVKDSNGESIPNGIQLRPFQEHSWYFQSASHALRILHDD